MYCLYSSKMEFFSGLLSVCFLVTTGVLVVVVDYNGLDIRNSGRSTVGYDGLLSEFFVF
jgi:uncharacterized membrane protein